MANKDIFISYKAEEFQQAKWVKETLEANGISCWMAPLSIIGGASYASEIPKAIRNCRVFALILSEIAQTSKWIPRELDQAINDEKIIMPFMLENCQLNDAFRFYLTNVQRYYGFDGKEEAITKMIVEIRAQLGMKEQEVVLLKGEEEQAEAKVNDSDAQEESVPETKEKKKKEKKTKEKKVKEPGKKKNVKKILGIAGGALAAAVAAFFIINAVSHVTIAGQKFKKSDYKVEIEDAKLTQSDINNFEKFKELDYIELIRCDIGAIDISAITDCEDLYRLTLRDCNLSLPQLQSLDFSEQTFMYELDLSGNPALGNFSRLNGTDTLCENLDALYLNNTELEDVVFAEAYPNLETLSVEDNNLISLEPLSGCIYMKNLYVGENELTSLSGLENMTLLEIVDIHDNQISDISVLNKSVATLKELHMEQNQISDLSSLEGAVKLGYIAVNDNQITSLEALGSSPDLKLVYAANNQLTSMEGLGGHSLLQYVDLSNNQIVSMETSAPFVLRENSYGMLDLSYNQISELMLENITTISDLFIQSNPIEDLSGILHIRGTKVVFDYSEDIDWERFDENSWGYCWIFGVPLDKQVYLQDVLGYHNVEFVNETQVQEEKTRYMENEVFYY